jgi:PrtD family type I secretion system ABC transporter
VLALGGASVLILLTWLNQVFSKKLQSDANLASAQSEGFTESVRSQGETVQGLGMRQAVLSRWQGLRGRSLDTTISASDRTGVFSTASKTLRFFLQSMMLGLGAWLVIQGQLSPGMMIAASILMGRALAPVEQAVGQWRGFVNARTAYQRLNQLLLTVDDERERMQLPTPEGRLSVERAVVAPPGSRTPVLKGVSFELQPGEALGVIGPSGAGKSTLARALVGVWPIGSGHVRLDGADITDWNKEQLGPHLGYVPQDVELFDGTVAENIARFQTVDPDEVVRAAKLAGVHEMILQLPEGYDTQIGAGGQSLSGGQRQRVALARALYGDVRFILLDEPNANLDSEGEKALTDAIAQLREQGRTVAMITHRPQLLSNVDKVLALDGGQVQAFGPRQEVLNRFTRPAVVSGGQGTAQIAAGAQAQGQGQAQGQTQGNTGGGARAQGGRAQQPRTQQAAAQPGAAQPGAAQQSAARQAAVQQAARKQGTAAQGRAPQGSGAQSAGTQSGGTQSGDGQTAGPAAQQAAPQRTAASRPVTGGGNAARVAAGASGSATEGGGTKGASTDGTQAPDTQAPDTQAPDTQAPGVPPAAAASTGETSASGSASGDVSRAATGTQAWPGAEAAARAGTGGPVGSDATAGGSDTPDTGSGAHGGEAQGDGASVSHDEDAAVTPLKRS